MWVHVCVRVPACACVCVGRVAEGQAEGLRSEGDHLPLHYPPLGFPEGLRHLLQHHGPLGVAPGADTLHSAG